MWTQAVFPYPFWTRYLDVFDRVSVLARVQDVEAPPADFIRADGAGVCFSAVPYYLGPREYLLKAKQVQRAVQQAISSADAVILRAPGRLGTVAFQHLRTSGRPYGLEVVGNPHEAFAPGAVKHPLRAYFRWQFSKQLKRECQEASAVSYVTEKTLQRSYPPADGAFTTHYSSIELTAESFVSRPRTQLRREKPYRLVTLSSLAQLHKAPDILIDAIGLCSREGLDLQLALVGDGRHRQELEERVKALGLEGRISFLGQLPAGKAVREQLDKADVFVLPSKTEGLPRAMIEAMARGLPCIGSTAGGIPELLSPEDMVPPSDAAALAGKIREVVTNPKRMMCMSARNLEKAKEYQEEVLRRRRIAFYSYLKEKTVMWSGKRSV